LKSFESRVLYGFLITTLFGVVIGASGVYLLRPVVEVNKVQEAADAAQAVLIKAASVAATLAEQQNKHLSSANSTTDLKSAREAAAVLSKAAVTAADLVAQSARFSADSANAIARAAEAVAGQAASAAKKAQATANE
jgi:hypothetical protein